MGEMKDLLISGSGDEELQTMVDNARDQHAQGYIQFLEEHLEKAEKKVNKLQQLLRIAVGPGHCVECFKSLPKGEIICGRCQDECDGRWDDIRK